MTTNRSMLDFPRNEAGLVDEFIGTAYDTVKKVYDSLPEIRHLNDIAEAIPEMGVVAVEAAMVPAREEIGASVAVAEGWADTAEGFANQAEQSANESKKVNQSFPFTFNVAQTQYNVSTISGDPSTTTGGMVLWVEGAIEYAFTINTSKLFTINDPTLYPDGCQMRLIVNAHYDNAARNFDELTASYEQMFGEFLDNSNYEQPVAYAAGLDLVRSTQTVLYLGEMYRVAHEFLPLTTTTWAADQSKLVAVGDAVLRQDMADDTNPLLGSGLSGFVRSPLADQITNSQQMLSGQRINIFEFAKYIPVRVGPPAAWDWTLATATAQASLVTTRGIIDYPAGQYPHRFITKIAGVSLEGRGSFATYFTALPYVEGVPYGLVNIGPGAVSGSHMKGIHIMGSAVIGHNEVPVNPNQWGCYFKAQWDATYQHGGHWFSIYDDVRISNFNKGMWTRGGYTINNYQRPIQFLQFRNMFIQVPTGGEALRMTGQHGQVEFSGGSAEGSDGMTAALCINLGMDPDPSTMADNASGQGESTADLPGVLQAVQAPYNVNFSHSFSIQKSRKGITAANTRQISIRGAWIEDIAELIDLTANGQLLVEASHMANAARGTTGGGAAGSGYLFKLGTGTALEFKSSSDVIGTVDNYTEPTTNLNTVRSLKVEGLAFGDTYQKFKAAGYKTFTLTGAAIDVGAHKFVVINPSTGTPTWKLSILQATAAPGERITIRPLNGPITLDNLGNISLLGESEVCCPQSGVLVLERIFQVVGNVEWVLVSVSTHSATAALADGFYYPQNHRTWRRGAVANQYMGWIVTTAGIAGSTLVQKTMPILAA